MDTLHIEVQGVVFSDKTGKIDLVGEFERVLDSVNGLIYDNVSAIYQQSSLFLLVNGATYGQNIFLPLNEATNLRREIITGLVGSCITSYKDVMIRSNRSSEKNTEFFTKEIDSVDGFRNFYS